MAANTQIGPATTQAMRRGAINKRRGSRPIISKASTWRVTRIACNWLAISAPVRAARAPPARSGNTSRTPPKPTTSPLMLRAPKGANDAAACTVSMAPQKKPMTTTTGKERTITLLLSSRVSVRGGPRRIAAPTRAAKAGSLHTAKTEETTSAPVIADQSRRRRGRRSPY